MSHLGRRLVTHVWISQVTHFEESCPTYEWVLTHTYKWVRDIWQMFESWHRWWQQQDCSRVKTQHISSCRRPSSSPRSWLVITTEDSGPMVWMRHDTHIHELFPESECVVAHMSMRHGCRSVLQCVAVCCSVLQCVAVSHMSMRHDTHINAPRHTYEISHASRHVPVRDS